MPVELQALSLENEERAVLQLDLDDVIRLGRAPTAGWQVAWDRLISREHADLHWHDGVLSVDCLERATNPLIFDGQPQRHLSIAVGGEFRIGQTLFRVVGKNAEVPCDESPLDSVDSVDLAEQVDVDENDSCEDMVAYRSSDLHKVEFSDPSRQMEKLALLPDLISTTTSDIDLALMLVDLLLDAIPSSVATAVLRYNDQQVETLLAADGDRKFDPARPATMRVATRDDFSGRFRPSGRMIRRALKSRQSVMHIWDGGEDAGAFTMSESLGWAFCTPIRSDSREGWCLYVAGEGNSDGGMFVSEEDLTGDLRFTELVAQFISSIRMVRTLESQRSQLKAFFSPKVMESLTNGRSAALAPSQQDISVLFCDVRGFSRKSEILQGDLFQLLGCVKQALGVMANGILNHQGAIADFQGDAALGFWGWPASQEDGPVPACRAALEIAQQFHTNSKPGGALEGFRVGIGIAHGTAIAGEIGTDRQAKIGVFGPVVNQGSRLEGLTKQFGISICVDETTAEFFNRFVPKTEARVRRIARVRPAGMETPLTIYQLTLPEGFDGELTDELCRDFDAGLDAVIAGNWTEALRLLGEYKDVDGPAQFLMSQMAAFEYQPPAEWDGVFSLTKK